MTLVTGSCHCGAVRFTAPAPVEVTECSCSICRRYGVLWAYYTLDAVQFEPPTPVTDSYRWNDRTLAFHRCKTCGCVTHWWPERREDNRLGLNARLFASDVLAAARLRHLDGAGTERYID